MRDGPRPPTVSGEHNDTPQNLSFFLEANVGLVKQNSIRCYSISMYLACLSKRIVCVN